MPISGSSKNVFERARDAFSTRDEKVAMEAALKEVDQLEQRLDAAEKNAAALKQQLTDSSQKAAAAEARASAAEKKLAEAEARATSAQGEMRELQQRVLKAESRLKLIDASESRSAAAKEAAGKAIMAEHTLKADETLSHLSLKYYGSGYEPYWRVIYEANKELIGENPARVRPGMVIKIPVLPDELKNK